MYYDLIERQKRSIIRERKFSISILTCGLVIFALFLLAAFSKPYAIFILLIPLPLVLIGVYALRKNNRLIKQFSNIAENKAINKTYEVELYRPTVGFMARSEFRRGYYTPMYLGITITDERKNEYYYFFPEATRLEREDVKKLEEKFYRTLKIQCYENTSIVRTVEKDPHFLRFKFGRFYE